MISLGKGRGVGVGSGKGLTWPKNQENLPFAQGLESKLPAVESSSWNTHAYVSVGKDTSFKITQGYVFKAYNLKDLCKPLKTLQLKQNVSLHV